MKASRNVLFTASGMGTLVLALIHSLRARGLARTARLLLLGLSLPAAAELGAVNLMHSVRHHGQPRVLGVPISAVLGWFNITYGCLSIVERLLARWRVSPSARRWLQPLGVAAVATSLDLVLDCFGLDEGFWEWPKGGAYARELVGPNGQRGVPWLNYWGWLLLTGGVTALARPSANEQRQPRDGWTAGGADSARFAAVLLAPYYLPAAAWAVRKRKPRYLLFSALFPASALAAVWK